jgi:RimJ/RimL family protein N-acetyltransferase
VGFGFEFAGLRRIISVTRTDHAASRRVMEKCGLTLQEQVTFRDVACVWYAIDGELRAEKNRATPRVRVGQKPRSRRR